MRAADVLHDLIKPDADSVQLRRATIAAFTATSATITLAGKNISGVRYLSGYAPAVGHKVYVIETTGGLLLILGRNA